MTEQTPITRPASPTGADKKRDGGFKPSDYNPDLANTEMVKSMMDKLPTPAIVSKKFTVFQGLLKSLNHSEKNKTYIDTTLLSSLMDEVSRNSVNVDGALFKNFWAYMMHPIFNIMQGGMMTPPTQQEEQPGFFGRIMNRIRERTHHRERRQMDNANKQRAAVLFQEECRLFWEFILMKLHIRKATDEDKIKWRKDWKFVTEELKRL